MDPLAATIWDPVIWAVSLVGALAIGGTLFGTYEAGKNPLSLGAGKYYWEGKTPKQLEAWKKMTGMDKRGLDMNTSLIMFFNKNNNITQADMEVLNGMVIQPIEENMKGHNAYIWNEGANFTAAGFISGLNAEGTNGVRHGNISITMSTHNEPLEGKWLFVDESEASEKDLKAFKQLEKTVYGMHEHRAVLSDLFSHVQEDEANPALQG